MLCPWQDSICDSRVWICGTNNFDHFQWQSKELDRLSGNSSVVGWPWNPYPAIGIFGAWRIHRPVSNKFLWMCECECAVLTLPMLKQIDPSTFFGALPLDCWYPQFCSSYFLCVLILCFFRQEGVGVPLYSLWWCFGTSCHQHGIVSVLSISWGSLPEACFKAGENSVAWWLEAGHSESARAQIHLSSAKLAFRSSCPRAGGLQTGGWHPSHSSGHSAKVFDRSCEICWVEEVAECLRQVTWSSSATSKARECDHA